MVRQVIAVGGQGFWQTAVSLAVVLSLGYFLMRFVRLRPATMKLITVGTSICGGSAIAAVSSVMKADDEDIGVSMGVVFLSAYEYHLDGVWDMIRVGQRGLAYKLKGRRSSALIDMSKP